MCYLFFLKVTQTVYFSSNNVDTLNTIAACIGLALFAGGLYLYLAVIGATNYLLCAFFGVLIMLVSIWQHIVLGQFDTPTEELKNANITQQIWLGCSSFVFFVIIVVLGVYSYQYNQDHHPNWAGKI